MLNCVLNLLLTQHFASTRDLVQPPWPHPIINSWLINPHVRLIKHHDVINSGHVFLLSMLQKDGDQVSVWVEKDGRVRVCFFIQCLHIMNTGFLAVIFTKFE